MIFRFYHNGSEFKVQENAIPMEYISKTSTETVIRVGWQFVRQLGLDVVAGCQRLLTARNRARTWQCGATFMARNVSALNSVTVIILKLNLSESV